MLLLPGHERDNPGNAIITLSISKLVSWFLILSIPLIAFVLIISFYGISILGMSNDPLQNRAPGAVAGIPPASDWIKLHMPEQKAFLMETAAEFGVPWQAVTSICLIESEFGKTN